MADWSSLPSDLINRVADCLLATNDLDHYMDLRAVCHNWRSSTADPRTTAAGEPRFRPRCWVMLEEHNSSDRDDDKPKRLNVSGAAGRHGDTRLFVNAATGRFLRKRLPLLLRGGYNLVTTTPGGFLVLSDTNPPHAARVLNPFTGAMARFRAPMPLETHYTAAVVNDSNNNPCSFTLVMACLQSHRVYWADPESEAFLFETCARQPSGMLPYLAGKYAGRKHGDGAAAVTDADELATKISKAWSSAELEHRICAVESTGGEILMLSLENSSHCVQVYKKSKADAESEEGRLELEQVTSLGNHALFFGDRCLLVDADKLPSVDANCVYYQLNGEEDHWLRYGIFRYDLAAGKAERIAETVSANSLMAPDDHPLTLIQLLVNYAMYTQRYELIFARVPEDLDLQYYCGDDDDEFEIDFDEFGD